MMKLRCLMKKKLAKNCHGMFTMVSLENTIEVFLLNVLFLQFSVHMVIVKKHVLFLCLEIITRFLVFVSSFIRRENTLKCGILKSITLVWS